MSFNDPIAEMLTKIRNAKAARHRYVDIGRSKIKLKILEILKHHRFIENFLVSDEKRMVRVFLRYNSERSSVIQGIRRISRGGLRRYVAATKIPQILNGMGLAIVSTPQGIMDGETARKMNVGGELLCSVW